MDYFATFMFYLLLMVGPAIVAKRISVFRKNKAIRQRRQRAMRQYTVPAQRKGN